MIHFSFSIRNPFYKKHSSLFYKNGSITQHKKYEFEINRNSSLLGFEFSLNAMQDHAGLNLSVCLLTVELNFQIYDCRHWNHLTNSWH
jgi:hypothetical protein